MTKKYEVVEVKYIRVKVKGKTIGIYKSIYDIGDGYAVALKNEVYYILAPNGEPICNKHFSKVGPRINGNFTVVLDGKWVKVDKQGNILE